ncbi:hypothetical protein KUC3_28870 [Alteromonas sp. KC3]|uniref:hypothetical protein n=1 Tax=unclassified Alteromonas TaxID=2614992 RepID=UPI0019244DA7|nr:MULTISPECIES: hypothetical protein [unclassified Alteromonas]BCO20030.1 hypothetical protein KUC3_28870 [Alteromonas sp. KC3]BCO23995.1 hypothetical protein KUC14_28640 [Alteromonas sp. KC14]
MTTHIRKSSSLLTTLLATILVGCSISPEHHVRTGADPRYQDKNVAFQTTYYFRVFDYCSQNGQNNNNGKYPSSGGLYRFKMTGKANTWANDIKFESGILKSWELDPLGANVVFDENIGRHRFVSENETQNEAAREQAWADYTKLKSEYLKLAGEHQGFVETKNALSSKLHNTILSEGNVIAKDGLSSVIDDQFEAHGAELEKINTSVQNSLKTAIEVSLENLKKENKEKLNPALYSLGLTWLKDLIKAKLVKKIEEHVTPNLPDDLFSDQDNSQTKWNMLIGQLEGKQIDFTGTNKNELIKKLALVYSQSKSASNISTAILDSNGTQIKIADKLSELFIEEVKDFELKGITTGTTEIFSHFKSKTQLINNPEQPDQLTYKMLDAELKIEIKTKLTKYINDLFATQTQFLLLTDNLPKQESIEFESDSSLSGILALANESSIRTALAEFTKLAIGNAVSNAYFEPTSQLSEILTTLKSAMAKKLALATGLPILSNSESDSQLASTLIGDKPIDCDINQRRGFQILGPEGWRTFNQDERLTIAMSADNKPITQTLKALSKQVLNAQTNNESESNILPIMHAELRLGKAINTLNLNKAKILSASKKAKYTELCELSRSVVAQLNSNAADVSDTSFKCEEGE